MERLVRSVEKGRSPGDDFADQVIDQGIAATVAQLAQGGL
jgi:glutamate--cysteine ligase